MDFLPFMSPLASAHGPCGEDLIFSAEFDEIKAARHFDDPSISQGEWIIDVKEADWPGVARLCKNILTNKSKDLRVASWLIEAQSKTDGLSGLADGYALLGQLCEAFWNDLHPQPEDGDIEQRAGALDWLAKQTPRLLREVALTRSSKGNFSLNDHEAARATAKQIERQPAQADEIVRNARVSPEAFEAATKDTPKAFFAEGLRNAERVRNAVAHVQAILDSRMGDYSPAFGQSFERLEDISHFYQRHAGAQLATPMLSPIGESNANPSDTGGASGNERIEPTFGDVAEVAGGPIRSREQAIRQLQDIAAFFRRTEPHSPVAYLAEKAAKWGSMPLHEWLRSVVKDDSALLRMEELLGVEAAPGETN